MSVEQNVKNILENYGYGTTGMIAFSDLNRIIKQILNISDQPYVLKRNSMSKPVYGNDKIDLYESLPFRCKKCENEFYLSPIELIENAHQFNLVCPICIEKIIKERNKQKEKFEKERLESNINRKLGIEVENIYDGEEYGYFESNGKGKVNFINDKRVLFSSTGDNVKKIYRKQGSGGSIEIEKEVGSFNDSKEFISGKKTNKKNNNNTRKFDSFRKKDVKENGYIHKESTGSSSINPIDEFKDEYQNISERAHNEHVYKETKINRSLLAEKKEKYSNLSIDNKAIEKATSINPTYENHNVNLKDINDDQSSFSKEDEHTFEKLNKIIETKKRNID